MEPDHWRAAEVPFDADRMTGWAARARLSLLVASLGHALYGIVAARGVAIHSRADRDLVRVPAWEALQQEFAWLPVAVTVSSVVALVLVYLWLSEVAAERRLRPLLARVWGASLGPRPQEPAGGVRRAAVAVWRVLLVVTALLSVAAALATALAVYPRVALLLTACSSGAIVLVISFVLRGIRASRPAEDSQLQAQRPRLRGAVRAAATAGAATGLYVVLAAFVAAPVPVVCPHSSFGCQFVTVPVDHSAPGAGRTFDITFGVRRAPLKPKGVLLVAVGGPGASGLANATRIADSLPTAIRDRFDLVVFDQRGVARSGGLNCPGAEFRASFPSDDPIDDARDVADACVAEAHADPSLLPFYGTQYAAEDVESIRAQMGAERLYLYGESYGTQLVQEYAIRHPERVAAAILDGPVDVTLHGEDFWAEATRSFERTLLDTLHACNADATCRSEVDGGDAVAAFDELLANLDERPQTVAVSVPEGYDPTVRLTADTVRFVTMPVLYDEYGRMRLLQAVAAASNDVLEPLGQLVVDEALEQESTAHVGRYHDPEMSGAAYLAVECADYTWFPGGSADARADRYVRSAYAHGLEDLRMKDVYLSNLPCVFWPSQPTSGSRPPPLADPSFPVFVLTATADPITPVEQGRRIAERHPDAYLIEMQGGPHVIFGRGASCPDDTLVRFLIDDVRPSERRLTCPGAVIEPYEPIFESGAVPLEDGAG